MLDNGLYTELVAALSLQPLLGPAGNRPGSGGGIVPNDAIFFGVAAKEPPLRFLVINIEEMPAGQTLDGPSALMDGELQFDGYAETQLVAKQITKAVMNLFGGWGGTLPDGSTIQFVEVTMHRNADFQVGGTGYIFHSVLRMKAFYTEATGPSGAYTPQFYVGDGPPVALHNNDDIYYDEFAGNLYEQVLGAWVQIGNIAPGGSGGGASMTLYDNQDTGGLSATGNPAVWMLAVDFSTNDMVFRNGQLLSPGVDYATAANLITYAVIPSGGDALSVATVVSGGGGSLASSLVFHRVALSGTNAASIKGSAGIVTGWKIYNNTNYPIYVKLFDKATEPVPGTDTPKQTIGVDAGESDVNPAGPGISYLDGIGFAITKMMPDGDATPVVAGDCVVDIFWQ